MFARSKGSFAAKSIGGFAAVMLLLLVLLMVSFSTLQHAFEERERIVRTSSEDLVLAERLRLAAEQIVAAGHRQVLAGTPELLARRRAAQASFDDTLATLIRRASTIEGRVLLARIEQAARAHEAAVENATSVHERGPEPEEALRVFEARLRSPRQALEDSLARFIAYENRLLERVERETQQLAFRVTALIIGTGATGLVASSALVWGFTRGLTKLYRRERAALQRANDASAMRDEILRIVAHDLRSPLGAVQLKATMIRTAAPDVANQAESIEKIVMRVDRQIRGLLDVASLETGRFTISPERCEAGDLLARTVNVFGALAAAKSIRLDVSAPSEHVFADRERVLQVLSNLVDNAIKFTAEHGIITISASRVGADVEFVVKDTGRGIKPEHLPHVFERYWKAEVGGKTGAGLGLYIAKRIIEAHGGTMRVESTPGAGTSFYFTLPDRPRPSLGAATLHAVT